MEADRHAGLHLADLEPFYPPATPAEPPAIALLVVESPGAVAQLRATVRGFAAGLGLPAAIVDAADLAVGDAATTIVVGAHAGSLRTLEMSVDYQDGTLEVVVSDHGQGLPVELATDAGCLPLVGELSDDFCVSAACDGIEVWMRFVVDREQFDAR